MPEINRDQLTKLLAEASELFEGDERRMAFAKLGEAQRLVGGDAEAPSLLEAAGHAVITYDTLGLSTTLDKAMDSLSQAVAESKKLSSLRDAAAKILDAYGEVGPTVTHALAEAINELAAALDGAPAKTPPAMALNTYVVSLTRQVIRYQTLRVEGVEAPDEDTAYAVVKDMPQYGEVEWKYTGEMQDIGATDVEVTGPRGCIAWREH